MRKIIPILLAVCLVFGVSQSVAASGFSYGNTHVYYNVMTVDGTSLNVEELPAYIHDLIEQSGYGWLLNQETGEQTPDSGQATPAPAPDENKQAEQSPADEPTYEQPTNNEEQTVDNGSTTNGLTADEQQMVDLVNQARASQGLAALEVDMELVKVARVKAQDMIDNGYFDHHSPTYGSPFDMLNAFGVSYRTAGENLAGNQTVDSAHQSLMNSSGHRANILNTNYTHVGIGIIDGGPYGKMFVQLFKG